MDENGYLNLLQTILKKGVKKQDRTGIGTLSVFGEQLKFSLENDTLPIITTKKVFTKAIIYELLWFISGKTDSKILEENNVNIWKLNSSRDFLSKRGLEHYNEGDIGPMYGYQLRHFNAKYIDCNSNYKCKGIDQLKNIIHEIKNNPDSRRHIMTTFNPSTVNESVLYPCHGISIQFYVNDNELSCMMTQRSSDTFLGLCFNITSYSLLTHMIAKICNLKAKALIINLGDTHIYLNHIEQVKEQLSRKPLPFPKLEIERNIIDIDDFNFSDFNIIGYKYHPAIKAPMAV